MAKKPSNGSGLSLEEKLLHNAIDTVVKNRNQYDAPALIYLVSQVLEREDLGPSIHRLLAERLTSEEMASLGIVAGGGMIGTDDDAMNFLTMPRLHRTLLRGIQQMQEKLMPGGFLLKTQDIDHADATRMLRDCTSQLEKVLRLTKAARANAEVLLLKEALAEGLKAIRVTMGAGPGDQAFKIMNEAMRNHLGRKSAQLAEEMGEAEALQ